MKKFLIGLLVFALVLFILPSVVYATPKKVIPVASGMGTVKVWADADYLYVKFKLVDSTDARKGENLKGNDQISINVNPGGGPWGFPYDLIFETSADLPWNPKVNSGVIDGWNTRWFPNNAQKPLPSDLESFTNYKDGTRTTNWKIPLAPFGVSPGDELLVGGAIEVGDGSSYVYPVDLEWSDASTFVKVTIPVVEEEEPKVEEPVEEEEVYVRTHDMTCYQVYVNDDGHFEFIFWWEYKNNNWVSIYDMEGNLVYIVDFPHGKPVVVVDLPDGMYIVKTFHEGGKVLQEFVIGK